jgi:hypothetical protein
MIEGELPSLSIKCLFSTESSTGEIWYWNICAWPASFIRTSQAPGIFAAIIKELLEGHYYHPFQRWST